jgi:hypothetical protein
MFCLEKRFMDQSKLTTPSPRLTTSQGKLAGVPRWAVIKVPLGVRNRADKTPDAVADDEKPSYSSADVTLLLALLEVDEALFCCCESGSKLFRLESILQINEMIMKQTIR